jgi:hypothetical protein
MLKQIVSLPPPSIPCTSQRAINGRIVLRKEIEVAVRQSLKKFMNNKLKRIG